MSLRYRYGVDYWYRSADDTDRSVRTYAVHPPDTITGASYARLARVLDWRQRQERRTA